MLWELQGRRGSVQTGSEADVVPLMKHRSEHSRGFVGCRRLGVLRRLLHLD